MPTREILHAIVNRLPESELLTAARILMELQRPPDPMRIALANAPVDDEPFDPTELEGPTKVRSFRTTKWCGASSMTSK
jgi:hypothetical protein